MAEYIVMPKLGFDMREGVLNTWLKSVGDPVEQGEIVAEIESDKATLEVESQVSGTLLKFLEEEGAIVPVGANMAIVGEEGEDISGMDAGGEEPAAEEPEPEREAEAEPEAAVEEPAGPPAGTDDAFPGGVKATPVARRIAREQNVDLAQVGGSGPGGRVRKADVEAYLESPPPKKKEAAPAARPAPQPADVEVREGDEVVEMSRLRQAIGRRMVESKTTVPHFYVTSEIDVEPLFALRKQINNMLESEEKISVNDMIVKAAGLALRDYPNLNAAFNGDSIVRRKAINVGSAVAVEGGLLTVVQKNTDKSSLSTIARDNKRMIAAAREGKINPADVDGGTFTVSNLGAFDVDHFIAIINPPEGAILAIGSAKQTPVVKDGELAIGMRMKVTISADHRVTDGAEAAQFLQHFKALMEEPMRLLV